MEHVEVGKRGREIILCVKIDDYRFTFINVYAPNDIKTQVEFFESLKLRIRKFADENIIIGGDLNCCLTPKDKRGGRPTEQKKQLIDSILSLANSFNLVDVWRKFHPNESLFTWHHQSSAIQCRLDYWLVSKHLLQQVKQCNIIPVSFSDHSAVSFNIQSDDFIKRGPGFFKFNDSLLDDQCFVEDLSEKIPEYKQKYDYLENKSLYWDMLKIEIRSFTIYYCKRNAKTKKAEEALLQEKLSSLHKLMCENPTQETIANYYEVKMKLEQISLHKTEGAMIRSKARWCEQGERSTRYFFNLEKRIHSNKYITKLRVENGTFTSSDEILNEEHRYHKRLYT